MTQDFPNNKPTPPEALMLLSHSCSHCPVVLQGLSQLVKEGVISRLEVVNIAYQPEMAQQMGVRSVPWVRLGAFELLGALSLQELKDWANKVGSLQGATDYLLTLLEAGAVQKAVEFVAMNITAMTAVLQLLGDPDLKINTRLGLGVVMESLEGSSLLADQVDALGELTQHPHPSVRLDACHYLSLTGETKAVSYMRQLLEDPHAEVREIAQESLSALEDGVS